MADNRANKYSQFAASSIEINTDHNNKYGSGGRGNDHDGGNDVIVVTERRQKPYESSNREIGTADKNESEPVIAADLTRYATPLALLNGYGKEMSKQKEALTKSPNSDGIIIAADLTKYNNPLDNEKTKEINPL
ncbi:hypothetical protein Ahia01_000083500 [Argonauta hians]